MTYNVTGATVATIGDGGIVVDMQGNPDAYVVASSNAAAGASNLMWMQRLGVTDAAGQGGNVLMASSTATGAASDAEIGLQHVSMALAGTGGLNGRTDLAATATGGGSAHTIVSDISLSLNSSAVGTSLAPVMSQIHMGVGEGAIPGILASASDAGSTAITSVQGNITLTGHGDDVYVYNSGLFAQGTNGGVAATDIGGNVSFASDGREAHSYILVNASTDAAAGSAADVHLHGNVDLHSTGSELALTRAGVHATGAGTVEVDGHLNLVSDGPIANSFMQVTSEGTGHAGFDSVAMNVNGGGHGWMDLYSDHSGGLAIDTLNLAATAGSDVTLRVQHANDALTGVVDNTFIAHADGTVGVSIATANVGGAGETHMLLNAQTFGTINEAASVTRMDVHYQLADQDFTGIGGAGAVPMTNVNGYHGELIYNGVSADATNFTNAGGFTTLAAMNAGMDAALDGTHKYVFAVYNGTEDINGNGVADDNGSGVLAWDDDGIGVTSVVMLHGITNLTPTDIA